MKGANDRRSSPSGPGHHPEIPPLFDRVLVCFAVRQEAAPFLRQALSTDAVRVRITGMGARNAREAAARELKSWRPTLVLTCGYAGGLDPQLAEGAVIFEAGQGADALRELLIAADARPARFHCAPRVLATAAEKRALRARTGADAVEMESGVIRDLCAAEPAPCVTLRVVLDTAGEDLPLDFNAFMDANQDLQTLKLAAAVARAPSRIPSLLRFQRRSARAAERLASALCRLLAAAPPGGRLTA